LRACAALPANLDWRLTICGDELYETDGHRGVRIRLEDIAKELRIADRVAFAGMVKDLGPYWRDADVFLHGSVKPEPFGRVVAEAMLAELPVIAPNAGGIPEFVRDGIDGLLYPMGDFRALRDAIVSVASGAEGRNAMGAAARQRIERDFPIEATVERVERSLADVIAGRNLHRSRICVKSA
jgi:glycosyltransferase involved in cell wall biosynthesis